MTTSESDLILDLLVEWESRRRPDVLPTAEQVCPDDQRLQSILRHRIERRLMIERAIEPERAIKPDLVEQMQKQTDASSVAVPLVDIGHQCIDIPTRIGRYSVERLLGAGGYGRVYLGFDAQLDRHVAIKIAHPVRIKSAEREQMFLLEAKALALMDHPHIVPVYDVGSTDQFTCFIVSKYVPGKNLAEHQEIKPLSITEVVRIIAIVAEGLHYAHTRGVVHRDIKPRNILISDTGEPYLVDFGLALSERDTSGGHGFAGTPHYMSPEQARGEGHRVDGRSDIFCLGIVLYELLVGRKPFQGHSTAEILSQIISADPKPPRQINDLIPRELERICLKSLSKRATERYTTARDMAEDLWELIDNENTLESVPPMKSTGASTGNGNPAQSTVDASSTRNLMTVQGTIAGAIPRGLRSFEEVDADFFLRLLPGPYDRWGLPESIEFWKTRIEEKDPSRSFSVGLLYGPSGCGKSSLVKAGLIPRVSGAVTIIYLEADANTTESRLLQRLQRLFPRLAPHSDLVVALADLRNDISSRPQKFVIVIDQFEQWLHSHPQIQQTQLVAALRQCDGIRLQCLIMVRDDFWMAATRFMREIEIPLLEGRNSATIDLFPLKHARKVLALMGQAYGALPVDENETTFEQHQFLDAAIDQLAEHELVIPVRLALFGQMLKSVTWVPATLKQFGGNSGIGIAFLEATFASKSAPPSHRVHEHAARQVLTALLPSSEIAIKTTRRSWKQLQEISGYSSATDRFQELIAILDGELRLISPADMTQEFADRPVSKPDEHSQSFQLTHDYLVVPLREWLTQKQRETQRGQAELVLAQLSEAWGKSRDQRFLPSFPEISKIWLCTKRSRWSDTQRQMVNRASQRFAFRLFYSSVIALLLVISLLLFDSTIKNMRLQNTIDSIQNCTASEIPAALTRLHQVPKDTALREIERRNRIGDPTKRLHLNYAQAELGRPDAAFFCSQIGVAPPEETDNLVAAFRHDPRESIRLLHQTAAAFHHQSKWMQESWVAILLMYLGDDSSAESMCHKTDSEQFEFEPRAFLTESLHWWSGDLLGICDTIRRIESPVLRATVLAGLTYPAHPRSAEVIAAYSPLFKKWYLTAQDAATHSASGLALLMCGAEIPEIEKLTRPNPGANWHQSPQGLIFIRVAQSAGTSYSSKGTDVDWSPFELCDREVNVAHYLEFLFDGDYPDAGKPDPHPQFEPNTLFHPAHNINWHDAILFCNWLSWKNGYPPCYERADEPLANREIRANPLWKLNPSANGYRLPLESEWRIACQAGTSSLVPTNFLLINVRYATVATSTFSACGVTLPNAWGFFDLSGNVAEWTHFNSPSGNVERLLLDVSYLSSPSSLSFPAFTHPDPSIRLRHRGFRVARTIRD